MTVMVGTGCDSLRHAFSVRNDLAVAAPQADFGSLDNITPLRQLMRTSSTVLFGSHEDGASRIRWSLNTDAPLPPDEPAGENPLTAR